MKSLLVQSFGVGVAFGAFLMWQASRACAVDFAAVESRLWIPFFVWLVYFVGVFGYVVGSYRARRRASAPANG